MDNALILERVLNLIVLLLSLTFHEFFHAWSAWRLGDDTAARLVDLICGCEFTHDGDSLPLSVAIGVGLIDGQDGPETVMARADEEMYRRKAAA